MSRVDQSDTRVRFSLQNFAPGWGAAVMGTSVIATFFASIAQLDLLPSVTAPLAVVFLLIAILVGIVVISLMTARLISFPRAVLADLSHPVKGGMSATFGGSFLTLAVAIGRAGGEVFGESVSSILVGILATIGGALALVTGWIFLSGLFAKGDTDPGLITGALFIPPVVTVIIPAAYAPLIQPDNVFAGELLAISWGLLGIGATLYLVITAALFYRTMTRELPPAQFAPSLFIGMGPAGLIAINLVILMEAAARIDAVEEAAVSASAFFGAAMWGFGLWWMIASLLVIRRGYRQVPFGVATWGFTFPLGAWSLAGVTVGSALQSTVIQSIGVVGGLALVIVWIVISLRTIGGIRSKKIFAH